MNTSRNLQNHPHRSRTINALALSSTLAAGSLLGTVGGAAPAHAALNPIAAARNATAPATGTATNSNIPSYPAFPGVSPVDFGRVVPGNDTTSVTRFTAPATGTVRAQVTAGGPTFSVSRIESYNITRVLVDVDASELPPGHTGRPPRVWVTQLVADTSVAGSGPLAVQAGEIVEITVGEHGATTSATGTLAVTTDWGSAQAPITMFVGSVKATVDMASLTLPQGRSADVPVTVQSLGGPATDVSFDVYKPVDGITVTIPVVRISGGQTIHTSLHVVNDRNAPLGLHNYNVVYTAFGDAGAPNRVQKTGAGDLNLTVTNLPTRTFSIPFGQVAGVWNNARTQACEVIKDQMGKAVVAAINRTIRNPECSLAPLQLTATQQGSQLSFVGSATGNRVGAWVTTPDGIPGALDPYFFMFYDAQVRMDVVLPTTLDGMTGLRIRGVTVNVSSSNGPQSGNWTGDIAQAVATAFGYGGVFQPFHVAIDALGNGAGDQINGSLKQFDPNFAAASVTGFTRIDYSLDATNTTLNVRFS
jgi:hypothetical protein